MLSKEPALLKVSALHLQKIKMVIKYLDSLLNISAETLLLQLLLYLTLWAFFENVVGLSASVIYPSYLWAPMWS